MIELFRYAEIMDLYAISIVIALLSLYRSLRPSIHNRKTVLAAQQVFDLKYLFPVANRFNKIHKDV